MADGFTVRDAQPAAPDLRALNLHRRAPPSFPLHLFDERWGAWIRDAAEAASAPPDYVAGPLLAAASAVIGNARWAQAYPGWDEPPHLWVGCVGDSGGSKSPGADPVLKHIVPAIEREMQRDFPDRLREWQAAAEIAKARKEAWEADVKRAAKSGNPPPLPPRDMEAPPAPKAPALRSNDATIEVVSEHLAGGAPKGLLMVRDELAGHLLGMTAYNDGARAFWLESYGGRPYRVDRKKSPVPIIVPHLACAWWGGTQPARLQEIMEAADDGLLARFMWFWPDPLPFNLPARAPDMPFAVAALTRLHTLQMLATQEGPAPIMVPLAADALTDMRDLAREMQGRQKFAGGLMSSALGKARGLALRLSLIFEFLWWCADEGMRPPPAEISRRALAAAAEFVADYAMPMAERTYGDATAPKPERDAATLARWIVATKPREVHGRALQRDVRLPGLSDAESINAAAAVLIDDGWLLPRAAPEGAGRPRVAWVVNPALWEALP
ncbi:DUF3987 domain-containing protein [Roseomonas eburnea]|uniref:DUF3987 domain-containing protein n=1 Tax=Neoroseomonas eburnea TaxID=1346889 RepID=A0A9X9XET3_9PROT|nr:DUF3987 domain-containing protein [Neoroseomonas eburnea]MBR0682219.1 DUF3987 domain-containing protein [Neoroseomonas eburnea]